MELCTYRNQLSSRFRRMDLRQREKLVADPAEFLRQRLASEFRLFADRNQHHTASAVAILPGVNNIGIFTAYRLVTYSCEGYRLGTILLVVPFPTLQRDVIGEFDLEGGEAAISAVTAPLFLRFALTRRMNQDGAEKISRQQFLAGRCAICRPSAARERR